ncbi:MAG TPA: type IX secretion system outer membrane channel protein PorV [Bacteroidales bacterium]|nr:type IX secretion system outer membrane channel protein PorV [Bacteroidales bacterium]HPT12193.1 type IX secretion system outer membrane channel protein PorV [Bacteroidales bacterium]
MRSKLLVLTLILPLFTFTAFSQQKSIHTVVPFLTISPDARSGAMGDVGVATTPDVYSMHWNCAKYAVIDGNGGFALAYTPWLRSLVPDINIANLSVYTRIDARQVIAASLVYSSLGTIQLTDGMGAPIRDYKPNEFSLDAAYSRLLTENFSGGIALRFIYSNITGGTEVEGYATKAGTAFAADISGYYSDEIGLGTKNGTFSAGFNFSNIGSKMSYSSTKDPEFIPMNMRLGAGLSMSLDKYNKLGVSLDLNKLLVPSPPEMIGDSIVKGKNPDVSVPVAIFQSFYDAPGGFSEEMKEFMIGFGAEYWYNDQFAIRAGYFNESKIKGNLKYFTMGAGLRLNIFTLDFSYLIPLTQTNPLARTLRFSLSFDFESLRNARSR